MRSKASRMQNESLGLLNLCETYLRKIDSLLETLFENQRGGDIHRYLD